MAADKVLFIGGVVQFDGTGKVRFIDTATAGDCECCGVDCTCPITSALSYAVQLNLAGCAVPIIPCNGFFGHDIEDGALTVFNLFGAFNCLFRKDTSCNCTNDIRFQIELIDDPTLGCVWFMTCTASDCGTPAVYTDLFTGYRAYDPLDADYNIVGSFTRLSGCSPTAVVS